MLRQALEKFNTQDKFKKKRQVPEKIIHPGKVQEINTSPRKIQRPRQSSRKNTSPRKIQRPRQSSRKNKSPRKNQNKISWINQISHLFLVFLKGSFQGTWLEWNVRARVEEKIPDGKCGLPGKESELIQHFFRQNSRWEQKSKVNNQICSHFGNELNMRCKKYFRYLTCS